MAQHVASVLLEHTMVVVPQQLVQHVRQLVDGQQQQPVPHQPVIVHVIRHKHQATVQAELLRERQAA